MYRSPSDRNAASAEALRRYAGAAAIVFSIIVLVGCEDPLPPVPAALPALERPVVALDARRVAGARVLVPAAALISRGGIAGVFVLQEATPFPPVAHGADGKALPQSRFRMVKTARMSANRVEILSGLAGNEVLVVGELSDVHDGSPIVVKR